MDNFETLPDVLKPGLARAPHLAITTFIYPTVYVFNYIASPPRPPPPRLDPQVRLPFVAQLVDEAQARHDVWPRC